MDTVNVTYEGAVAIVELDRPDALNAFNGVLMDELTDAFLETENSPTTKVVVLTGAGRAFSAGADLQEMGRQTYEPRHGFDGLLNTLINFSKPFIVAVNGVGAGIGATICGLADLTFISKSARLRCPFSALGLTAEAGSTLTFPLLMGKQKATWFLLSAEWMTAEEVVESGLALELLEPDELMPHTIAQAQILAALPLSSLQTTKKLISDPWREQILQVTKAENKALAELMGTPGNKEALSAFREKREPNFTGL